MSRLRAPGVYFESADPPSRAVAEVRTDIAAFVGVAERGPLHAPVRIENATQFRTRFGDEIPEGFLARSVRGFFANGGRTCWVVRVGVTPRDDSKATLLLANKSGCPVFRVSARDFGPATEDISVRVEPATRKRFTLVVSIRGEVFETWRDLDPMQGVRSRNVKHRFAEDEVNAPEGVDDPAAVTAGFTDGSVLIELESISPEKDPKFDHLPVGVLVPRPDPEWEIAGPGILQRTWPRGGQQFDLMAEGRLGSEWPATTVLRGLTPDHLTGENQPPNRSWGLRTLELIDDVGIVVLPDLMWPGTPPSPRRPQPRRSCRVLGPKLELKPPVAATEEREPFTIEEIREAQRAAIRHCAAMRDRFAVLDAPAGLRTEQAIAWATELRSDAGQYAALYYPWVFVPDSRSNALAQAVPPSGHVAGVFARVDRSSGVHKPPANEAIEAVSGTECELDPELHGWLNDEAVNVIRAYPGRGIRVAGARTLVPPGAAELRPWRFVNVRRLLLMLEESIEQSTQWVAFEPNVPARWREVDRVVRNFLDDEWRKGRLDGATAEEAYDVTCDETTNPPEVVEAGQMVCVIGVQPPAPAEFVIVRLGRRVGEDGAAGTGGANGG